MTFHVPNQYRVRVGQYGSDDSYGNNGAFFVPCRPGKPRFTVIASDQLGWDHVSVSLPDRCPVWAEMCKIKELFWDDEDAVMQLHPPKSDWVNNHDTCLHLWRPQVIAIPLPPSIMVGIKEIGELR